MTETSLSKWEQAISKLIESTQDGKLEWKIVHPNEYLPKDDTNGAMLTVNYGDKHLLLFKNAYMRSTGGVLAAFTGPSSEVKDYRPNLCVYDTSSKVVVYTFPHSELVNDLYKAATFNASKIEELINNILSGVSK
jgi:hypothetical protein